MYCGSRRRIGQFDPGIAGLIPVSWWILLCRMACFLVDPGKAWNDPSYHQWYPHRILLCRMAYFLANPGNAWNDPSYHQWCPDRILLCFMAYFLANPGKAAWQYNQVIYHCWCPDRILLCRMACFSALYPLFNIYYCHAHNRPFGTKRAILFFTN